MARTAGYPYDFVSEPWDRLESLATELRESNPHYRYLVDIVRSIVDSDVASRLAGAFWMHDLAIAETPIRPAPIDLIVVRGPGSLDRPPSGLVRIEYLTVSGHNDVLDRPYADAIPLFWRFVKEKFGVEASPRPF